MAMKIVDLPILQMVISKVMLVYQRVYPTIMTRKYHIPWNMDMLLVITIFDILLVLDMLMWEQCHKPPITGNGKHTTYRNGDLGDGLLLFYPH